MGLFALEHEHSEVPQSEAAMVGCRPCQWAVRGPSPLSVSLACWQQLSLLQAKAVALETSLPSPSVQRTSAIRYYHRFDSVTHSVSRILSALRVQCWLLLQAYHSRGGLGAVLLSLKASASVLPLKPHSHHRCRMMFLFCRRPHASSDFLVQPRGHAAKELCCSCWAHLLRSMARSAVKRRQEQKSFRHGCCCCY